MFSRFFLKTVKALAILAFAFPAYANTPLPKEITINDVEFVLIPGGWTYRTGGIPLPGAPHDKLDEFGGGNIKVWVDSFYAAKYEARARHLVPFLNSDQGKALGYDGGSENCAIRQDMNGRYILIRKEEDLPATHLSWELSDAWATDMGFRLLTEAEWERAARGDSKRIWPWGDAWPDETYLGFRTRSNCYTWPVDSFAKGQSPFGIFNMSGNIREYVSDWYSMEADGQLTDGDRNPVSLSNPTIGENPLSDADAGPWKMLKGGRWASGADQVRISARIYYRPHNLFRCNGTRFALDANTVKEKLSQNLATVTKY